MRRGQKQQVHTRLLEPIQRKRLQRVTAIPTQRREGFCEILRLATILASQQTRLLQPRMAQQEAG